MIRKGILLQEMTSNSPPSIAMVVRACSSHKEVRHWCLAMMESEIEIDVAMTELLD